MSPSCPPSAYAAIHAETDVTDRQACNLPVGPDGMPIIGAVPGVQGAYVVGAKACRLKAQTGRTSLESLINETDVNTGVASSWLLSGTMLCAYVFLNLRGFNLVVRYQHIAINIAIHAIIVGAFVLLQQVLSMTWTMQEFSY